MLNATSLHAMNDEDRVYLLLPHAFPFSSSLLVRPTLQPPLPDSIGLTGMVVLTNERLFFL